MIVNDLGGRGNSQKVILHDELGKDWKNGDIDILLPINGESVGLNSLNHFNQDKCLYIVIQNDHR